MDGRGAKEVANAVERVHALALAVDEQASRWFTTSQDRAEKTSPVHLAHVQSPASLAQALASLAHMAAPLAKFDLSEAEHESWAEAFHGGWCSAEPTICGESLQVASLDVSSCFALMAHHLGWWDVMTAERLRRQDVTEDLRHFCADVAKDPTMALDPGPARFGLTLVEARPSGQRLIIELEDEHRPDGHTECVSFTSADVRSTTAGATWWRSRPCPAGPPEVVTATVLCPLVDRRACAAGSR